MQYVKRKKNEKTDLTPTFCEQEEKQYMHVGKVEISLKNILIIAVAGLSILAIGEAVDIYSYYGAQSTDTDMEWDGAGEQWTCGNCGQSNYMWQLLCTNCGKSQ